HYDPMIAKLIASGRDRDEALARLAGALEEFTIAGIRTGLPFLRRLVEHPVFRAGRYDTGFIEEHMSDGPAPLDDALRDGILAAVARTAAEALDSGTQESIGFEVSLPGEPSVPVEVVHGSASSAGSETGAEGIEVRVKGRPLDVEVVSSDGVLRTLRIGDALTRLSLVEKKRGRYDVGLRDRVLASKVERLADPGAIAVDAPTE
ncbi:MAG TPA: hypothetical protein VKA74_19555, partial [Myxococcota bacterium]|nr:hypothetical protein [Myxococcota bacterium]